MLSKKDLSTTFNLYNLAILEYNEKYFKKSAELMRHAGVIWKKKLGEKHPDTIAAMKSLDVMKSVWNKDCGNLNDYIHTESRLFWKV